MFRAYGIKYVTMDMLAAKLGISKRTIYEVFNNKEELLAGVLKYMSEKQAGVMAMIMSETGNMIEAVLRMLELMRDHFKSMSPAFHMDMKRYGTKLVSMMGKLEELPFGRINREILKKGISEGVFRDDIEIEIINKSMLEVARMAFDGSVFPPGSYPDREIINNLFINYLRGISTPKGIALIELHLNKLNMNEVLAPRGKTGPKTRISR